MKRVAIYTSCITEMIGHLPGVATTNWADRAAASLAKVIGGSSACVLVGSLDARGFLIQVEIAGAGRSSDTGMAEHHPSLAGDSVVVSEPVDDTVSDGLDELRRCFKLDEWVGWSLGPITSRTLATTSAGLAGLRRTDSPVWRRWSTIGEVGEIVAGVVAVPGGASEARVVLVEIACPVIADAEQAAAESSMVSAVLEAVLPLLASKVAAAFITTDRGQWLTPREEEVLWHLLAGEKVPNIATALGRSVYTVHDHVKSLHRKLGASNRGELVSRALGHIGPRTSERTRGGEAPPPPSRSAGTGKRTRL